MHINCTCTAEHCSKTNDLYLQIINRHWSFRKLPNWLLIGDGATGKYQLQFAPSSGTSSGKLKYRYAPCKNGCDYKVTHPIRQYIYSMAVQLQRCAYRGCFSFVPRCARTVLNEHARTIDTPLAFCEEMGHVQKMRELYNSYKSAEARRSFELALSGPYGSSVLQNLEEAASIRQNAKNCLQMKKSPRRRRRLKQLQQRIKQYCDRFRQRISELQPVFNMRREFQALLWNDGSIDSYGHEWWIGNIEIALSHCYCCISSAYS